MTSNENSKRDRTWRPPAATLEELAEWTPEKLARMRLQDEAGASIRRAWGQVVPPKRRWKDLPKGEGADPSK